MKTHISVRDAARITGIPRRVINCWIDSKRVPGTREPGSAERFVDLAEVQAFASRHRRFQRGGGR
jgi:hypothetical protein